LHRAGAAVQERLPQGVGQRSLHANLQHSAGSMPAAESLKRSGARGARGRRAPHTALRLRCFASSPTEVIMFRTVLRVGVLTAALGLCLAASRPAAAQRFSIQAFGTAVNESSGINTAGMV